ncbi:MAG: hypothetical protein O7D95_02910 [Betaproteobacteria bacterium]|nr:hypothetical protein [Betaproteobacteria bacterium]
MDTKPTKLYRYRDHSFWQEDNPNPICSIELETFRILKYTAKGGWINKRQYGFPKIEKGVDRHFHKFVLLSGRKRYAYPDKESAWTSYVIRKQKQIIHLQNRLHITEICYDMAKQNVMESRDLDVDLIEPKKLNLFRR